MSSHSDAVARAARHLSRTNAQGWGRAQCPFCPSRVGTPDPHTALSIHPGDGLFKCFRCGAAGRYRSPSGETVRLDAPRTGVAAQGALGPPPEFEPLWREPGSSASIFAPARDYLSSRSVTPRVIREARIGACHKGRLAGRVVVPVLDRDGFTWLGWSARLWGPPQKYKVIPPLAKQNPEVLKLLEQVGALEVKEQPKYLTCPEMDRASTVWNVSALDTVTTTPVMLMEGVFDALPYWPDAVAFLGKPTEQQKELMINTCRPLAVVLDGDAWFEGKMCAVWLHTALNLQHGLDVPIGWVKLPPARDPGDLNFDILKKLAKNCVKWSLWDEEVVDYGNFES